ncbi:hybrid sensor histidine kinase/response regulator, partial [candidate division TA06 bacterium]
NRKFDIVLLDLTIPGGMGGRETMEKLLKLDPDVKGIIVSGYSTDVIISEYKKYGFKEAVLKPFRMDELSSVLKKIINGD